MESIASTPPAGNPANPEPVSRPQIFKVPFRDTHLWLVIDDQGVKWTPVAQIACILALPSGDTLTQMDNNPAEYRHQRLDVPPILMGGSAVCLRMEHFHHFLRSGIRDRHVSLARLPMLQHLREEACEVLNSFQPEVVKVKDPEILPPAEPAKPIRGGLVTVDFHGAPLVLVEKDGQPHVAMKNVVEGMGLNWKGQHEKLTSDPDLWGCGDIHMVAQDGKDRVMTCLPLSNLHGWLLSIQASRVKAEIRGTLRTYQKECFQALHDYWTQGHAENPRRVKKPGVRVIISAALVNSLRPVLGVEGTRAYLEKKDPDFLNLPGLKPANPQQAVQPALGLVETPAPLQLEISVKKV